ncbi:uncharacterized protein LOC133630500 [Entelurus aequoreus]|uniref:uncharacterized protein LOC133630498 n=1 Tax=Entelurus aequoreus TaxID=161455 RepID=UPI002B1E6375|nr:uncharacterized protein LOC133630498 [Entelurus aequoreus]XP_061878097.1 uncharacterized protein LOC133630500 [Entelurus aequoreus]
MMARTYTVGVAEFKERWPALFEPFQINEELRRCTAVPLESTFMSQLDRYTPKLLELFSAKGGVTGQRIKNLLMELIQDPSASAVMKRDVTLRCLIEYTGESGQELISDYCGTAETTVHEDLEMKNMSIYICREPNAVGIIIEGVPVLTHLGNLAKACCLLLGLTYALNLEYPSKLSKTFEVFQRLFVGLDTRDDTRNRFSRLFDKKRTESSDSNPFLRTGTGYRDHYSKGKELILYSNPVPTRNAPWDITRNDVT